MLSEFKTAIQQTKAQYPVLNTNWTHTFPNLVQLISVFYDLGGNYLPSRPLTNIERLQASISAIDNIIEILGAQGVTTITGNVTLWFSKNHVKLQALAVASEANFQRLNALQYNIGQCLQHLDSLRVKVGESAFNGYESIGEGYEQHVRPLRNYIIHGNRLLDPPISGMRKFADMQQSKSDFIVNCTILLMTQIKPDLVRFTHESGIVLSISPSLAAPIIGNVTPAPMQTSVVATGSDPIKSFLIEQIIKQCLKQYDKYVQVKGTPPIGSALNIKFDKNLYREEDLHSCIVGRLGLKLNLTVKDNYVYAKLPVATLHELSLGVQSLVH